MLKYTYLIIVLLLAACTQTGSSPNQNGTEKQEKNIPFLVRVELEESGLQGYVTPKGDTAIAMGKYSYCFTDTFRNYAIVASTEGLIGINRKEEKLFEVFMFDNGPDYIEDGTFRIVKDKKIGYANAEGEIIIEPMYACAKPFVDGKASVALNCTIERDGEHSFWKSEEWFFIDKKGNKVE